LYLFPPQLLEEKGFLPQDMNSESNNHRHLVSMDRGRVLLTGATGYIGGRLAPRLLEAGYCVRCVVRSAGKLSSRSWASHPRIEVVELELGDVDRLTEAMRGCSVGYYLVHSMQAAGSAYAAQDRHLAGAFALAAERAGLGDTCARASCNSASARGGWWYDAGMRRRVVNVLAVVSAVVCVLSLSLVGRSFVRADTLWVPIGQVNSYAATTREGIVALVHVRRNTEFHYSSTSPALERADYEAVWQDLTGIRWLGIGWGQVRWCRW
jgi:hypothetical protein